MKQRVEGLDAARALAIIGMIVVNFKIVFGSEGGGWVKIFAQAFEGKASATFVFLAGVGLALMTQGALASTDGAKLRQAMVSIAKRAAFLFVVGLAYTPLWVADILHFYGVYMAITLLFIPLDKKWALRAALGLVLAYPALLLWIDYETAWNFETFVYADFWTARGFARNLFYNGFHPVVPWVSFMLLGLWFGRHDLGDQGFLRRSAKWGLGIFVGSLALSGLLVSVLSAGDPSAAEDIASILGTSPMPPMPFYMLVGGSFAIFLVSASVLVVGRHKDNPILVALGKTGKLALTFYVAHVVVGMGVPLLLAPEAQGQFSIGFSVAYSLAFSLLCVLFANGWLRRYSIGPLESVIRRFTR